MNTPEEYIRILDEQLVKLCEGLETGEEITLEVDGAGGQAIRVSRFFFNGPYVCFLGNDERDSTLIMCDPNKVVLTIRLTKTEKTAKKSELGYHAFCKLNAGPINSFTSNGSPKSHGE
jgi:hypothetical protein